MAQGIVYSVAEGVAHVGIDNPPLNALSLAVRVGLLAAIHKAVADPDVAAIAIHGAGRSFPASLDLAEYDSGLKAPTPMTLCAAVEDCAKPVIAVLHGMVSGAGCELALAAHYRIAAPGTRLSLPEVRMGLIPCAGATQRLPRLLDTAQALDLLMTGSALSLDQGAGAALVDASFEGDPATAARSMYRDLIAIGPGPRPTRDRWDGLKDQARVQRALAKWRSKLDEADADRAEAHILRLVEGASLLPFEAGLAMEEDAFEACLASDAAAALRHAFVVERLARRFPVSAKVPRPDIRRVAVLGTGPLAVQIVIAALNAGLTVHWGARDIERLKAGVDQLRDVFQTGVKTGGLTRAQAGARFSALRHGDSADMVQGVDMILHAARGQGDVPAPGGIVRAVAMSARVDALGLRFAPPVFSSRLVEVLQGPEGTPEELACALALADRLNKVPVYVRSQGASVAGRLTAALHRAADALVDLGAAPAAVDAALLAWGWPRAPFRLREMQGLEELAKAPRAEGAQNWSARLLEQGYTGMAGGAGVYDWGSQEPSPNRKARGVFDALRPPQEMPPELICERLLAAIANEGCRMLRAGIVQRASDIDVVALLALEFPRDRGGPMKAIGQIGMLRAMKTLERIPHVDEAFWRPEPVWPELVKNGRTFFS